MPSPRVASGITVSRRRCTRSAVLGSAGRVVAWMAKTAAVPLSLTRGGATDWTPGVDSSACCSCTNRGSVARG